MSSLGRFETLLDAESVERRHESAARFPASTASGLLLLFFIMLCCYGLKIRTEWND